MDDSIFAEIKKRLNLAEIIGEDYPLKGRGHEFRNSGDDVGALVVRLDNQTGSWYYYWNRFNEGGDVFNWLTRHRGMDMKTAVEYAAKRANVSLPEWTKKDTKAWVAQKAAEDLMTVATRVFEKWLWATPAAVDYCRVERAWLDETIKGARLGFSGFGTQEEFKEMRAELMMNNIDPDSPAAVAIVGFKGNVSDWAMKWGMDQSISNDDKQNGYLPGFMGRPRLIFPHLYFSQVEYLSSRNLERDGDRLVSYKGKNKSFNPRREFLGERKPYFGFNYKANSSHIVIVEGPADVITLAQWDVNAFGQIGVYLDEYWARELSKRHASCYYATDMDKAGQNAVKGKDGDWPVAELLGPLTQVVRWPTAAREVTELRALKDANDLLQSYQRRGVPHDVQIKALWTRLNASEPVAILAARDAARVQKSKIKSVDEKNQVMLRAFEIIAKLERKTTDLMLKQFVKAAGMNAQDFNRNLKIARGERDESKDDGSPSVILETFGGWFPIDDEGKKGWLLDYLYDRVKGKAMLAYRDPNGQIGKAPYLDINGKRYFPKIDDNVRIGLVQFPSDLGPEKSTKELVGYKELYFRDSFLLDNPLNYKIMAYWAQETWLYDAFDECSFIKAEGDANSGKSAIMVRAGQVCYRFTRTSGVGTAASIKYMKHIYKGVLFLDEVPDNLDEFDERVTMFNIAAMKEQAWITNAMPTKMPDGTVVPEVQAYCVYGPIMATMYGKMPQKATESRFIVIRTFEKTLAELRKHNIPRRFSDVMRERSLTIRNMDITWRLKNWQPRIQPPDTLEDLNVSTRVNQVTVQIKYLVLDDPKALAEVDLVVRNLYKEQQEEQQTGKEARVLDAIVAVLEEEKFMKVGLVKESELSEFGMAKYISYSDLAKVANLIMDEMNTGEEQDLSVLTSEDGEGDDDDDYSYQGKKKQKFKMTPQTIGYICRKDFRLPRHRMGRGFVAILDSSVQPEACQERIAMLKVKYGLAEFDSIGGEMSANPVPLQNDAPVLEEPINYIQDEPPFVDYEQEGLL